MILNITLNFLMAFQLLKEPVPNAYQCSFFNKIAGNVDKSRSPVDSDVEAKDVEDVEVVKDVENAAPRREHLMAKRTPPPPHFCMSMMMTPHPPVRLQIPPQKTEQ
jgi:hypothetical protein